MQQRHRLPRVLIIGYGSPLRGDDAVGAIVAERLAAELADDPTVAVRVCHCLAPELATELAEVQIAIFLDAAVDGPLGEALCRQIDSRVGWVSDPTSDATDRQLGWVSDPTSAGTDGALSCPPAAPPTPATHSFDVQQLLALTQQLAGRVPAAYVISTRAVTFDLADRLLSPAVAAAVPAMVAAAKELLGAPCH